MVLKFRNYSLDISARTHIMGILNITPDSFSDGNRYFEFDRAIQRAIELESEGADIIDIGGESTRPGSEPVPVEEELRRVIPVIKELSKILTVPISIDTYKAKVAESAIEAGASIVNDISGLGFDPDMKRVIRDYKVPVVIMHIKGTTKDMQKNPQYESVIYEIIEYLRVRIMLATESGIHEDMIIIDPGIGFGKTPEHNLEIIRGLEEFKSLKKPILIGPSRKAFIGRILDDAPPMERLEGTLSAIAISVFNGANIVRVHDVKETLKVVRVADSIKRGMLMPSPSRVSRVP